MSKWCSFFLLAVMVLFFGENLWAAQSTADVPVTGELRAAAREKVLGKSAAALSEEQYVIGHGDILNIQVYGEGDMSATLPSAAALNSRGQQSEDSLRASGSGGVQVRIDGRISLKHIGDVDAVGLTLTQLADYLKELYSSVFDDPNVSVVLAQSNSQRYTVMGKIIKPGVYYLDYPITIVQTVARCGGFTEWAKSMITLVRKDPKMNKKHFKGNTLLFDYSDFLDGQDLDKNILVEPGDIIIVN